MPEISTVGSYLTRVEPVKQVVMQCCTGQFATCCTLAILGEKSHGSDGTMRPELKGRHSPGEEGIELFREKR